MKLWRSLTNGAVNLTGTISTVAPSIIKGLKGTPAAPLLLRSLKGALILENCSYVIVVDSTFMINKSDKIMIKDSDHVWIENCNVSGAGTGISVVGSQEVVLRRNSVGPCPAIKQGTQWINCIGIYVGETAGIWIEANNIHDIAVEPGKPRIMFNQGIYVNGACSDPVIHGNELTNIAAHGIQARAGGIVTSNRVSRTPVGITFGYVNGAGPQHPGGCFGIMKHNVVTDNVKLSDNMPLGQAYIVGANTKFLLMDQNIASGDNVKVMPAIQVEIGSGAFSGDQQGVDNVTISNLVVRGYKNPRLTVSSKLKLGKTWGDPDSMPNPVTVTACELEPDPQGGRVKVSLSAPAIGKPLISDIKAAFGVDPIDPPNFVPPPPPVVPAPPPTPAVTWKASVEQIGESVAPLTNDILWKANTTILVEIDGGGNGGGVIWTLDGKQVGSQKSPPLYMWGDDDTGPLRGDHVPLGDHRLEIKVGATTKVFNFKVTRRSPEEIIGEVKKLVSVSLAAELDSMLLDP